MKKQLSIATLAMIMALGAARVADDANKSDLAAMQGQWQMVSGERGGSAMPDAMVKTGKRVYKDNELTVTVGGMLIMKAAISVDASKDPKTIDYKVIDGPSKGKTILGIYELKDDTFKSCFAGPDAERPTAFETKAGDGRTLSVWKKM